MIVVPFPLEIGIGRIKVMIYTVNSKPLLTRLNRSGIGSPAYCLNLSDLFSMSAVEFLPNKAIINSCLP